MDVAVDDRRLEDGHRLGGRQGGGLTGQQAERAAVLGALELALVAPDLAVGEGDVGVGTDVADRVHVVVDTNHRHHHTADVDTAGGAGLELVEGEHGVRGHAGAPIFSLSATRVRRSSARSFEGSCAITSSKKPSTTSRSATSGRTPRLSR